MNRSFANNTELGVLFHIVVLVLLLTDQVKWRQPCGL